MKDLTILEISSFLPASVAVFETFGIDYYRKGWRTLEQACLDSQVDLATITNSLADLELSGGTEINLGYSYFELPVKDLISRIRNKFHATEAVDLAKIGGALKLLCDRYPQIAVVQEVYQEFESLAADFLSHARHEEENLFPYIIKLAEAERNNDPGILKTLFHNDLKLYEEEHDDSTFRIAEIKHRLDNLHRTINDELLSEIIGMINRFIADLHLHLHFENNIVFPKARVQEERLRNRLKNTG